MHLQCLLGGQPLESFRKKEERNKGCVLSGFEKKSEWLLSYTECTILQFVFISTIHLFCTLMKLLIVPEKQKIDTVQPSFYCPDFYVSGLFVSQRKNINISTDLRTIGYKKLTYSIRTIPPQCTATGEGFYTLKYWSIQLTSTVKCVLSFRLFNNREDSNKKPVLTVSQLVIEVVVNLLKFCLWCCVVNLQVTVATGLICIYCLI